MNDHKKIEASTQAVYEQEARTFDEQRDKSLFEKKWLDLFISDLSAHAEILDVGCGTGKPIAEYLIQKNFQVTGVDFSNAMIELAKRNFPNLIWLQADMRSMNFEKKFDGIIAWNSFFHLNHADQIQTLGVFASLLRDDGKLLFTAGPEHGEAIGSVNGQPIYHSSLSVKEYQDTLTKNGLELLQYELNDPECRQHSIFLAQKK